MAQPPCMPLLDFYQAVHKPSRFVAEADVNDWYVFAINRFAAYLDRQPLLSDLTTETLEKYVNYMLAKGNAPATANGRMRHLTGIWRHAKRRGYVSNDVYLRKVREPKRLPTAWSPAEMESLVKAARQARGVFCGVHAAKWWPAVILFLYDTGLRRDAAFGTRFDEIDFAQKCVRIPAERMKNLCEQTFFLHDQTIEAILDSLPPRRQQLFPWPFRHQRALYGRFRRILKRAGLPSSSRDMFHKLRRTCATQLARHVGEAAAIQQLGHRTMTTIRAYIDVRFTSDHAGARALPRPGWDAPKNLTVEMGDAVPPPPLEPVSVRFSIANLTGAGDDVFARLNERRYLTGQDIRDGIDALEMKYQDFAMFVSVSASYLAKVMNGKEDVSPRLNQECRRKFGLQYTRDDEAIDCDPKPTPGGRKISPAGQRPVRKAGQP